MGSFEKRLERFGKLRREKDTLEEKLKKINEDLESLNEALVLEFESRNLQNIMIKGLGKFVLYSSAYPQMKNPELCHKWLRDKGFGDMIKEVVHPQTLGAFVRDRLEENQPLPEGVEVFMKSRIRFSSER